MLNRSRPCFSGLLGCGRIVNAIAITVVFAFAVTFLLSVSAAPARGETSQPQGDLPAEVLCAQGIALYRANHLADAIKHLRRALRQHEAPAAAKHYLGLALLRQGKSRLGRRILSRAARHDPKNLRILLDLARAESLSGNPRRALRTLRRASRLAPQNRDIAYRLGVVLLRLGQGKKALSALGRARPGSETNAKNLRLQRALAAFFAHRWTRARDELQGLLSGPRSSLARQLLRASYDAQGTPASFISASIHLGVVADSNPLYEHETQAPAGLGPSFGVALALRPWIDAHNLLWGEAAAQRVSYFALGEIGSGPDPSAGSFTDLRLGLFYARQLPRTLRVSLGYRLGLTLLDAGPPLADRHHIFAESHAGVAALAFGDNRQSRTRLRLTVSRAVYAAVARSAFADELWLEHQHAFLAGHLHLAAWATARYDVARANRYDALSAGGGAALSLRGPGNLLFGTRAGYRYINYYASGGAYSTQPDALHVLTPRYRLDHIVDIMVEVARKLPWGLRLGLVYRYLRNVSSVTSFDYDRHLGTFDVSWSGS